MSESIDPPSAAAELTAAVIEDWLRTVVAGMIDRPAEEIRSDLPLSEYGMQSVYLLGLCAEIEDCYHIEVGEALVWDYPALGVLSEALLSLIAAKRG